MARLVITIGLPGSGKSTAIKDEAPDLVVVSPDHLLYHSDGTYEFTPERAAAAWRDSYQMAASLMKVRRDFVFDATFTTVISRSALLHLAKGMGYNVEALWLDTPVPVCMERNDTRPGDRRIPDQVLFKMAAEMQPPTSDEGWDRIVQVRP